MKKVIKGRLYDTTKAKKLGVYEPNHNQSEWAEKHLDGDDYIAIFGEPVDDDSRQTISLSLSAHKVAKLKQAAAREEISISAYIENLIE